jgi:hypothetical protein
MDAVETFHYLDLNEPNVETHMRTAFIAIGMLMKNIEYDAGVLFLDSAEKEWEDFQEQKGKLSRRGTDAISQYVNADKDIFNYIKLVYESICVHIQNYCSEYGMLL